MKRVFTCAILLACLIVAGCDSTETVAPEEEVEEIRILPENASMEVGESTDFSVVGLTAAGDTVRDHDLDIRWWSSDAEVFTVDDDGLAVAEAPGTAFCMVETVMFSKAAGFVGRDSAMVMVF